MEKSMTIQIRLASTTKNVLKLIEEKWPINPLEIAKLLNDKGKDKSSSAKYLYHFKKLYKAELIEMKRIGNTYIAWPKSIEKMRDIENKRKMMIVYDI